MWGPTAGVSTHYLSHCVGPSGRVYAFEPDPLTYELLLKNIVGARQLVRQDGGAGRAYAPLFPGFSGVFMENTRYSYDRAGIAMRCIGHNTIGKSQDCTAKV